MSETHIEEVKFSVIVPVYNSEKYLRCCIESVLNQSYSNYELLLVDDGSTDSSGDICDEYAQKYSNIHTYHKSNGGQLESREYAIKRATGDYYLFLDSDDSFRPDAMKTIFDVLQNEKYDCVIFCLERVFKNKVISFSPKFDSFCIRDKRALYKKCLFTEEYNSLCIKAVKASVFFNVHPKDSFYHIRHGEDLIQSLDVFANSDSVLFIDDVLYNYTLNLNSVSHSITPENYKIDFTVLELILNFLQEQNVFLKEDYIEYKGFCAKSCINMIKLICAFRIKTSKKRRFFNEIRDNAFYKDFISEGEYDKTKCGKDVLIFDLFQKKHYRVLIWGLPIYWKCHALLLKIKKKFFGEKNDRSN